MILPDMPDLSLFIPIRVILLQFRKVVGFIFNHFHMQMLNQLMGHIHGLNLFSIQSNAASCVMEWDFGGIKKGPFISATSGGVDHPFYRVLGCSMELKFGLVSSSDVNTPMIIYDSCSGSSFNILLLLFQVWLTYLHNFPRIEEQGFFSNGFGACAISVGRNCESMKPIHATYVMVMHSCCWDV